MDLLENLNERQKEAVLCTEGPLLILAGAGSGKTTVMTHRIAYIVEEKKVFPSSILAVTFTNNAANEMKERIKKLIGDDADGMWVGTFHSLSLRMLRRDPELVGYQKNFVIYDEDDKKKLLTQLAEKAGIDSKYTSASALKGKISELKNKLISPQEYAKLAETDFREKKIAQVYTDYTNALKENNALDFDDIILKGLELLVNHEEVLDYYRRKFRYVMVDEYQDTNEPQFQFVKLLSSYHRNICVVGDDDQSIYGWRGADITNILNFEKVFANAKVIKLEQNYRSTEYIIKAANYVIKHNTKRKDKTLFTELGKGDPIIMCNTNDERGEAEFVCRQIKNLVDSGKYSYNDIAVMYRTNSQSRAFEEVFVKYGFRYNMVGSLRFYERKEIKDIISYLRFIVNDRDEQSLMRIINVPPRGIGEKTVEKLNQIAEESETSFFGAMLDSSEYDSIPPKMSERLTDFCSIFLELSAMEGISSPVDIINALLEKTGYMNWLKESTDKQKEDRLQNISEFVAAAAQYTNDNKDNATLSGFLENMALSSDTDDLGKQGVCLMTIHAAKGCEYPVVFLTGLEQGLFPLAHSSESEEGKEEERRLFYVGITRARKLLYITWANSRWKFNDRENTVKSEFIQEVPKDCIKFVSMGAAAQLQKPKLSYSFGDEEEPARTQSTFAPKARTQTPSFGKPINQVSKPASQMNDSASGYWNGMKVEHSRYGKGEIVEIRTSSGVTVLTINFEGVGVKKFDASMAVLKKLS